ncbi:MAG: hypothetical protein KF894_27370 [Labilithrix sp.]|nr:hypothetical protein [Labilithrix sp.]
MYGQGHGHGHGYPYAPPPPPRSGPATLTIVLIVLGALTVLGGGACVVVGGLVYLGAKAEAEAEGPIADPALPVGEATSTSDTPPDPSTPPTTEPAPLPGLLGIDDDDDDRALAGEAPKDGASSGSASAPKTAGAGWLCNATGSVRVCGFANVCSNQMVSGLGSGADRFTASQSAKLACEGMARAKGGSTVCSVTCRPR